AVVATGIAAADWAAPFDSVSICLSKGLGAPVGSVLTGSRDFINRAHRYRKLFGGGMRQAGIIAAGGLYALQNNIDDLARDHAHAQLIAQALAERPGIIIDPTEVHTNIVIFEVAASRGTSAQTEEQLKQAGIAGMAFAQQKVRLVIHRDLSAQDIDQAVTIIKKVFA
ncbi:MAG: beta-eliminating lyase-related protein, partial [Candidatus Neomarinimicrobiota bacterium]